jgi:hypothetical protein
MLFQRDHSARPFGVKKFIICTSSRNGLFPDLQQCGMLFLVVPITQPIVGLTYLIFFVLLTHKVALLHKIPSNI